MNNNDLKQKVHVHLGTLNVPLDIGGTVVDNVTCRVIFRNQEEELVKLIDSRQTPGGFICGAVAWLTSEPILKALARAHKRHIDVFIIVQKEDFLRPDDVNVDEFKTKLRKLYDALGTIQFHGEHDFNNIIAQGLYPFLKESVGTIRFDEETDDVSTSTVRCLGNDTRGLPSSPRMHNKFILFGREAEEGTPWKPYEAEIVWTGSYNMSKNATLSFENVVVLTNKEIAQMYLNEFALMYVLTEKLDWESKWMAPNNFIGS